MDNKKTIKKLEMIHERLSEEEAKKSEKKEMQKEFMKKPVRIHLIKKA